MMSPVIIQWLMAVVSPCVWDEIFIIQMKGKNGIWMANGVE